MHGTTLKRALLQEYGAFADRRIKDINKGKSFIVDDRKASDHGADKRLFSTFCMIFADVEADDAIDIRLIGNVPMGPPVRVWLKTQRAKLSGEHAKVLTFSIEKGGQEKLRSLARAISSITAPGAPRYAVPSYKYVCPRTAKSLLRLATALDKAWKTK